jgi:glycosyltransferase involved in cell wall biosynthesis
MQKVAILCFTDFTTEPRVLRTINALSANYELTVFSTESKMNGVNSVNISQFNYDFKKAESKNKWLTKYHSFIDKVINGYTFQSTKYFHRQYWSDDRKQVFSQLNNKFDLVIGHGIYTVPLLAELSKTTKTIFNAHEYYLKEFEENESWLKYSQPYYQYILDTYLTKVNKLFSVSKVIGDEYLKKYKLPMTVVTNATSYYANLKPTTCEDNEIKLVHHGAAIRSRQLELMAEAVLKADDKFSLTFMLVPTDEIYLNELVARYGNEKRILFKQPVKVNEIAETINSYDIGLFFLPPVNYNWENALPNKLFEFIQARLCIIVSPNPDMKRVVKENEIGVVTKDYSLESLINTINTLTPDAINLFKQNAHITAANLNGDVTMKTILNEVKLLLN